MHLLLQCLLSLLLPILCSAHPQFTNNAPFSGAIYIVDPNGQAITNAVNNVCPAHVAVSCSNINQPSWCCPNSYTCASPANAGGLCGCCPAGSSCGGTINAAGIATVTVAAVPQTSYVYEQPPPTVVVGGNVPTQQPHGYCSTLIASGPGLPTERAGGCGTILVVNKGTVNPRALGYSSFMMILLLQLSLGKMFQ